MISLRTDIVHGNYSIITDIMTVALLSRYPSGKSGILWKYWSTIGSARDDILFGREHMANMLQEET